MSSTANTADVGMRRPDLSAQRLRKRYAAERRFRLYGVIAVVTAIGMLAVLLGSIVQNGYSAFWQTQMKLTVTPTAEQIGLEGQPTPENLRDTNFRPVVYEALFQLFPEVTGEQARRQLRGFVSGAAARDIREQVIENPSLLGTSFDVWVKTDDKIDMLHKGYVDRALPPDRRLLDTEFIQWHDQLDARGRVEAFFNTTFFTGTDSREPEQAGILAATVGSFLTLFVTLLLSFPIAVLAAVYLEEFAPKNKATDLIEVNINNLAAVPSIVYGLLGLAVVINFFGFPRSSPLVGGIVLSLMTLPTIIISARSALRAVPPSIREAALGVGASRIQTVTHHVLPLSLPGILTGTIIGMAQALGETAPLLMVGMVAFIVEVPTSVTDPSTVLPVQVFLWSTSPERAFIEKTSAAIMVLLAFLIAMNATAVLLRKQFERRW
ncbi:phosphate ABC transporter, permease protein PstA [Rhodovibrio sodomensis]|uniref:Phosphate transport system permease protein PstA n=1 Tax=Rhodovibrio sodomensis TaxID=1088 RepID=A0ABS1DHL7_9PROT|nr:phosphate ABC transporter permease PstA [Rhodovibrio sodomensis]MBK1669972.1 phosphate ABC transporter, permease protein PstA [Rhodovibrio sodomensis]